MMKLNDFKEYVSAQATYNELTSQLNQATEALNEAGRLSSQEIEADNLDSIAIAMLNGSVFEDVTKVRKAEVAIAEQRVKVLRRAVEMQLQRVQAARGDASATICKEMAPKYQAIMKSYSGALNALHGVIKSEQDFFDDLDREDILSRFERFSLFPESNQETLTRITKLLTEIKQSGCRI